MCTLLVASGNPQIVKSIEKAPGEIVVCGGIGFCMESVIKKNPLLET